MALCDHLRHFAKSHNLPWFLLGDFKGIRKSPEKWGGTPINHIHVSALNDLIYHCTLMNLCFSSLMFTFGQKGQ